MAKFYGEVGYGVPQETAPSVWTDVITEVTYYGELLRNDRRVNYDESVNPQITTNNSVSIVADAYAMEHFHAIRYVRWAGVLWTADSVQVQSPRLVISLGGVYSGVTAGA